MKNDHFLSICVSFINLAFCLIPFALGASSRLPDIEVQALKDIANTVGKKDWDFNTDPCSNRSNWVVTTPDTNRTNEAVNVTCDCSVPNDSFCHVVTIALTAQNLQGKLPPELTKLPYLQRIDLALNYLSGTIPREWGSSKLRIIHLVGNRLSGSIPKELANITSLEQLLLEFNNFSGNLPPDLGYLPRLERLHLTSNNFTGELPETFSRLTTLKGLRLGDNPFSGKIPDFIQRWTSLENLVIQGTGFSGPIPFGISSLQNLIDLRISDLNGPASTFPPINNMTNLQTLILRSCNLSGSLPQNLGKIRTLKTLDLSFNKLNGGIPNSFEELINVTDRIYLTGNSLTGQLPTWTKNFKSIDLAYNNFSNENPPGTCREPNMNLFASFSNGNNTGPLPCGNKESCPKTYDSFHINCGGGQVTIGSTTYDGDASDPQSEAYWAQSRANWALSTTGDFLNNVYRYKRIQTNESRLSMPDADLYMNARGASISLTYYGFCLTNGSYTVKLHFAEIMFTDDNTYSSLGRRVFDVYIQGKQVLKDFNIAKEAQGAGKALVKSFPVYVSGNDLEIRFYWAGKGTTGLPHRSLYGPIISAISVTADSSHRIPVGAVVGIVALAMIIIILIIVFILWWRGYLGKKTSLAKDLRNLDLRTNVFTLHQIKVATNNFDIFNKIGEGGFGPVYKGILPNGTAIAVKQLSSKSNQGNREFINEIAMISALQHPCLVKLYGCCIEGDQLLLVYEYLENNSLAHALFGPEERCSKLNWTTRHKICVGIARALAFLHEESRLKIVHRDIKATNVLLDKDLNPKVSDFGLAKLNEEDTTHISTRIAGTYGYMAPEYAMHGYLTDKADVYSFGIVALEIVSGKVNTIRRSKEEVLYLLDWVHLLKEKGKLMELVDRRLGTNFNEEEVVVMIQVALLCTNVTPNLRPSMSSVLNMLEGKTVVPEYVLDPSEVMDEMKLEAMRQYYNHKEENEAESVSNDIVEQLTASSSTDLYPVHLDSSYWEKRN